MTAEKYLIVNGRCVALRSFGDVKKGDKGGWVHDYCNLSKYGDCWVYDNAHVHDHAVVMEDAQVRGHAVVGGEAVLRGNDIIDGHDQTYRNSFVIEK